MDPPVIPARVCHCWCELMLSQPWYSQIIYFFSFEHMANIRKHKATSHFNSSCFRFSPVSPVSLSNGRSGPRNETFARLRLLDVASPRWPWEPACRCCCLVAIDVPWETAFPMTGWLWIQCLDSIEQNAWCLDSHELGWIIINHIHEMGWMRILSGKRLHNYGKIHHFQWENQLCMAIFNSYVSLPEDKSYTSI